jgi:hypothetical protein
VTGLKTFDHLEDLEILFNGFNEFDSLQGLSKLKRLCCNRTMTLKNDNYSLLGIDNGITRISNLEPISLTLTVLNLSDQVEFSPTAA